ncbi:MAG: helix-turn-helix domain-containing protein [Vampirovibrionales bacterium]|nr:helix-turn-helix domain-containing protein [Vampirovibrionales bacterium]
MPTEKKQIQRTSEQKWGKDVIQSEGFNIIPSLLLKAQNKLGLNSNQLILLLHLADYWWQPNNYPHPGVKTIGERMGLSPRQIQRITAALENSGFIKKNPRWHSDNKGRSTNIYILEGLIEKLKPLAIEVINSKKAKKNVYRKSKQSQETTI